MSRAWADFKDDRVRTVVALVLVAGIAALYVVLASRDVAMPIGFVLLPVLGVALVAGPLSTAVVGIAAVGVVWASYIAHPLDNAPARVASVAAICAMTVLAAAVRRRRERALQEQAGLVAVARDHEQASLVVARMLDLAPYLSGAGTIEGVAARAVEKGRELFGADACSYWQVDGDEVVLLAREPHDTWDVGTRFPQAFMAAREAARPGTRTAWVSADDPPAADERRRDALSRTGSQVGTSTPIQVDGATVAYLCMAWQDARPRTDTAIELLDRYGDQVALAKSIVRRRMAQAQTNRLGQRLQSSLLPRIAGNVSGVEVDTLYRPGTRDLLLGGDFVDVAPLDDVEAGVAFLIGDVSGHGPEPAALAVSLRAAWHSMAALHELTLQDWVQGMSGVVDDLVGDAGLFVTVCMGRLHDGQVSYVAAGHPPPLHLTPAGVVQGPIGGLPLGIERSTKLETQTLQLAPGDSVLLVTDGIFEGRTFPTAEDRLGWDEFVRYVEADVCQGATAGRTGYAEPGWLSRVADDMAERNGGPLGDDVACLLLRPTGIRSLFPA